MLSACLLLAFAATQESPGLWDCIPLGETLLRATLMEEVRILEAQNVEQRGLAFVSESATVAWQARRAAAYRRLLGPLPERTPLEPVVTGAVERDGYRIEKVHYQSRPHHRVTANLYLPEGPGPFPGVLVPCGHSANGKAAEAYQSACALFALQGFAVLCYDPISQGERHQQFEVRHGTTEHGQLNTTLLPLGGGAVAWELWDGVRSIDYLLSRPELGDARTVAVSGNSGGGTQTLFLSAFDPRVQVAIPSCFVMTHLRLFETIGPQDGCQWLPGESRAGLDHADYLALRAPRPTLVLAAERDFFDFAATRQACEWARPAWVATGVPEAFGLFHADDEHGFSQPRREAAASWLVRWVHGRPNEVSEPELQLCTDAELQVTASGQVLLEFEDELSVSEQSLAQGRRLERERAQLDPDQLRHCVLEHLALQAEGEWHETLFLTQEEPDFLARVIALRAAGRVPMGVILASPLDADGPCPATLLLTETKARSLDRVRQLVGQGRVVLSVDLPGFGETADRKSGAKYRDVEQAVAMLAMQIRRPLLGRRVSAARDALTYLLTGTGVDAQRVHVEGVGRAAVVALHLAVIDDRVRHTRLCDSVPSWLAGVVARPTAPDRLGCVLPGVLCDYDLPDLVRLLGDTVELVGD